ncbi:MAG TPA: 3'-5' exonuclease, partial [Candidatus Binatia bacterium]|nr:3'-5' exonuclease [Candidatus Binatia bacterium]
AEPPFRFWFWPRGNDKPISKTRAEEELPGVVAAEIARLLNSEAQIGGRRLLPEDIAVLVPENHQAQKMQEALGALNIPSVLHTTASLFDSREAEEVRRLLAAIAAPANERLLKTALATDILGLTGGELDALTRAEDDWQRRLGRFHRYLDQWTQRGFMRMFRQLLQAEGVRPRLLALADGERRLTNLLHLGEVLHQASVEQRLGVNGLVKWLAEHQGRQQPAAEEHQLRLERDENAVKLVTIHKSKGLEYGVVFCPFSWRGADLRWGREDQVLFHDRTTHEFKRDLGSAAFEQHKQWAMEERLAENVRLLYVALTRAKHCCYFVWGAFNDAETSAAAWLLHPVADAKEIFAELARHFAQLTDAAMERDLRQLARQAGKVRDAAAIAVDTLPAPAGEPYHPPVTPAPTLACRKFDGAVRRDWRISSFSSLTAGQSEDLPDRDSLAPELADETPAKGIFAFPHGAQAGTCLHQIFEQLDFTQPAAGAHQLVASQLRAHGFSEAEFAAPILEMLENVRNAPLYPGRGELALSRISKSERLNELEFHYPIERLSLAALEDFFAQRGFGNGRSQIGRLILNPVRGYLKGFMDLVFRFEECFYLVDWKSNWLGNRAEAYHGEQLRAEMLRRNYHLQYHLYT